MILYIILAIILVINIITIILAVISFKTAKNEYYSGVGIIITHEQRKDGMGSYLQAPITLFAIAEYNNWKFRRADCESGETATTAHEIRKSFETHDGRWSREKEHGIQDFAGLRKYKFPLDKNIKKYTGIPDENKEGLYIIKNTEGKDIPDEFLILSQQIGINNLFNKNFRTKLRKLYDEENKNRKLNYFDNNFNVAIHIRRGEIIPNNKQFKKNTSFPHAWIPDKTFINLIKKLKTILPSNTVYHIFSQNYGEINWKSYKELNCKMHLQNKNSSKTFETEFNDWHHFINADLLIVGSTFSAVPSLYRNKPTMSWDNQHGYFGYAIGDKGQSNINPNWDKTDNVDKGFLNFWIPYDINGNFDEQRLKNELK